MTVSGTVGLVRQWGMTDVTERVQHGLYYGPTLYCNDVTTKFWGYKKKKRNYLGAVPPRYATSLKSKIALREEVLRGRPKFDYGPT